MRRFEDYHPLAQFVYFLAVCLLTTVWMHPYLCVLSLLGSVALFLARNGTRHKRSHWLYLALFVATLMINLVFRHSGATVLLLINHNPVTLESLLFGVFAATMLVSVLYWCRSLSQVMTSDKLIYLFGKISPRLALIVSMSLRYIPLFSKRATRVRQMQQVLGAYREENLIDNTRASLATVSVMTTWALENGIVTADSMVARGYGVGHRTTYHRFRMHRGDVTLLVLTILLSAVVTVLGIYGVLDFDWYPYVVLPRSDPPAVACYLCYGLLAVLPTLIEIGEKIRWKYLRSRI